jgi:hypothetical protein
MTSETDEQFLKRLKLDVKFTVQQIMTLSDAVRLFALARRGAAAGKMLAEQDHEYNRKTNDLIARHAGKVEEAADRIKELEGDLQIAKLQLAAKRFT